MDDPKALLTDERLARLRASYDGSHMSAANVAAVAQVHPALRPWVEETAATFFDRPAPVSAKDRERCIVALLAYAGTSMSLAVHIYWGLMEGLEVDDVRHTIGLVACYGGLPRCSNALLVLDGLARVLARLSDAGDTQPERVLHGLVAEFGLRGPANTGA